MAAPNIKSVSAIYGKNNSVALSTTSMTSVLNNAASSGKVLKVNMIIVANVDGSSPVNITVSKYSQDDLGGAGYPLAYTVSVPAKASVAIISKDTPLYLEEDQSIGAQASASNDATVTVSYEEIS